MSGLDLGLNLAKATRNWLGDPQVVKDKVSHVKTGGFSDVLTGRMKYFDSQLARVLDKRVAIKVIRGGSPHNKEAIQKLEQNLDGASKRYAQLKDDNVILFYGVSRAFGYLPALILELCDKGNVTEYLRDFKGGVAKTRTQERLIKEVSSGLCYLHSQNIAHGDLRAANVLVNDKERAVIVDFGIIFLIDQSEFTSSKMAGSIRTASWSPPEVLDPPEEGADWDAQMIIDGDSICTAPYSRKSDVYSLAMVFYEICIGEKPFFEQHRKLHNKAAEKAAIVLGIMKGECPTIPPLLESHPRIKEIVKACWDADPANRPTATEVKELLFEELPEPQKIK